MKRIFGLALVTLVGAGFFASCVEEDDVAVAPFKEVIFAETFEPGDLVNNRVFAFEGWTNFAETGTKKWTERIVNSSLSFIQFNPFGSPSEPSNIGWVITPAIELEASDNAVLKFRSASNFVNSPDNKLEVLISTNFDGTAAGVTTATWTPLDADVADNTTNGYTYIPSGDIDLAGYTGTVHIAFRVTGNGSNLAGLYQVDDVLVYSNN